MLIAVCFRVLVQLHAMALVAAAAITSSTMEVIDDGRGEKKHADVDDECHDGEMK